MQEEVNQKTISLCINGGKITARILKTALSKLLAEMEKQKNQQQQIIAEKKREAENYKGKQSMKSLMKKDCQLSNIEITDGNIKSFERVAKKYGIDFSLKRDNSVKPARYYVFFRAKDVDVMTAAFREYTGKMLNKSRKPSVLRKLEKAKECAAMEKHGEPEKVKRKEQEPSL